MSTQAAVEQDVPTDPRPRAATGRGSLLAAELGRLRRRRLVVTLVALGFAALVAAMAATFFTHSTDLGAARAEAQRQAQVQNAQNKDFETECLADTSGTDEEKAASCAIGGSMTADDLMQDPRFVADQGLPVIAVGVAAAGALLMALVGATAVGADWSSRAILTLITWEPRRLRLLTARLSAVAVVGAVIGVAAQAFAFGLGALTVQLRGSWEPTRPPTGDTAYYQSPPMIGPAHFWRDLLSTQARGVLLMVIAGVVAAAVTTVTRHTGGLLGIAFGWFAVGENLVRAVGSDRGWPRWLVTENIVAFLAPRGQELQVGSVVTSDGLQPIYARVSNLDALLYLGVIAAVVVLLAGLLLRRRDL